MAFKLFPRIFTLLILLFVKTQAQNAAISSCPPLGPVLPAPEEPSNDAVVQATTSAIAAMLAEFTSSLSYSALSISAKSIHEENNLLNFHYTPPFLNTNGTNQVDADTVYRLASVSKVFTVLAVLQLNYEGKLRLSDPVISYVPELLQLYDTQVPKSPVTAVDWSDVTLEALTSELADIATQFGDDIANTPGDWAADGLPILAKNDSTKCGGTPSQRPCTRSDFFKYFGQRHPIYAPFTTPVYSNMGFVILGFVIEAVTGTSYAEYIQQHVLRPLNMTHTTVHPPSNNTIGFIPIDLNWWYTDFAIENPSGGFYSSSRDLLAFGAAILSSKLLTPTQTRTWLKPKTHTSSLGLSVGSPWEIARANNITSDGRLIDFYTKSGGLYAYNALLVLIPDYDVAMTVLFAGPEASAGVMYGIVSQVVEALLPAVEAAGNTQASGKYAGIYQLGSGNEITLAIDSGPGLVVTKFRANGKDILKKYPDIVGLSSGRYLSVRLYPTNLQSQNQTAWRAVFNTDSPAEAIADDAQLFFLQGACQSWSSIDNDIYGLRGLDDFVFDVDATSGRAVAVSPKAFRVTLPRVE